MRAALLCLALLLAGACSEPTEKQAEPAEPVHFGQCAFEAGASKLPDVALPCFTGGQTVRLGQLKGPLVMNFWASWCEPCRAELPAFQRLADRKVVPVIGVATDDRRSASLALGQDLGFNFPALDDPAGAARRALGQAALPLTVFVGADGEISTYSGAALTDDTLAALVRERIGAG